MAASSGAGAGLPIDPTKPGKYPVILSDALLGRPSKDAYTGVRYNHRPELSSETAPTSARIKQSSKDNTYNLGFEDEGNRYQYNGERTNNDGKYILVFDPARKAFILHRIDSMFHMNVTRTPASSDPEALRKEFPHLTVSTFKKPPKPLPKKKNHLLAAQQPQQQQPPPPPKLSKPSEPEKKEKPKPVSLSLPTVSKAPPPPPPAADRTEKKASRAKTPDSEEDDDDDDGGLLIEYPDGDPGSFRPPPPSFPPQMTRRFSEFVRDQDDDDDFGPDADADAEFEEDDEDDNNFQFKLPSPVNQRQGQAEPGAFDAIGDAEADDFADDLEAELERELLEKGDGMDVDESDVSEED